MLPTHVWDAGSDARHTGFELLGWVGRRRLEAGGEDTLLLLAGLSGDVTHKLDIS